jgi:hypothetical protein
MRQLIIDIKRSRVELFFGIILICCLLFIPPEARMGLLGLFITKVMGITIGVLYAHYSRIFLFRYLDLSKMIEEHHWAGVVFTAVWYAVIIYAFAVGG